VLSSTKPVGCPLQAVGIAVRYEIISNRDNIKVVKVEGVLNTHKEYGGISRVNDSQARGSRDCTFALSTLSSTEAGCVKALRLTSTF
jgi:hypothetical protein